jgi:hypothetical protein
MDGSEIRDTITRLVEEEHTLRKSPDSSPEQGVRLRHLEEELDQCWDLLRQRDALRAVGADPDAAKPRPIAEVEGYLQ